MALEMTADRGIGAGTYERTTATCESAYDVDVRRVD
jgi:hypothetical protein